MKPEHEGEPNGVPPLQKTCFSGYPRASWVCVKDASVIRPDQVELQSGYMIILLPDSLITVLYIALQDLSHVVPCVTVRKNNRLTTFKETSPLISCSLLKEELAQQHPTTGTAHGAIICLSKNCSPKHVESFAPNQCKKRRQVELPSLFLATTSSSHHLVDATAKLLFPTRRADRHRTHPKTTNGTGYTMGAMFATFGTRASLLTRSVRTLRTGLLALLADATNEGRGSTWTPLAPPLGLPLSGVTDGGPRPEAHRSANVDATPRPTQRH